MVVTSGVLKVLAMMTMLNASAPPQRPASDAWVGVDKVKHFLMSAFIQSAAFSVGRLAKMSRSNAQVVGGVSSVAFGVGKEILDRRRSKQFSVKDLVWDGAGALTAASLLNGTR